MIALGIGCRRDASADAIEAVVARALRAASLVSSDIAVIATAADKRDEAGIVEAAKRLRRPLVGVAAAELAAVADRAVTYSD
ncbi:MAG: cobalamin biosynthesis protein, partial [Bradyrhizobium sp.]|nr:cobalamin biosynthesis protein [Bradyrhizobium sp.]